MRDMEPFVWSKMQAEAGEKLGKIIARKEAERSAGDGVFWWGIGSSLGSELRERAEEAEGSGGTLTVVFSKMLSAPRENDKHPTARWLWTRCDQLPGRIPGHVLVTSG